MSDEEWNADKRTIALKRQLENKRQCMRAAYRAIHNAEKAGQMKAASELKEWLDDRWDEMEESMVSQ